MEVALDLLLVTLLPDDVTYNVISFSGKSDLLAKLPNRLQGYKYWTPENPLGLLLLIDEDRGDCRVLKATLERLCLAAGFSTKASPEADGSFAAVTRVVIEELEAWFFGDPDALLQAYPSLPASLCERRAYRRPDAIKGGTWEALERVLQQAGYHRGGLRKLQAAEDIAVCMTPSRNRSPSFNAFLDGLQALLGALSVNESGATDAT